MADQVRWMKKIIQLPPEGLVSAIDCEKTTFNDFLSERGFNDVFIFNIARRCS